MYKLFILGNGFDLNLNLPTSYKHFYRYYSSQSSESEAIKKLKEHIIQYEDQNWSDLEVGLGKYTQQIDNIEELEGIYIDINTKLDRFLQRIESIQKFSDKFKEKVLADLNGPERYLTPAEKADYSGFQSVNSIHSGLHIVTFNYTHTFEKVVKADILHIHKETGRNGVILGVDNPSQIMNEKIRSSEDCLNLMVKPKSNQEIGNLEGEAFKYRISNAEFIYLFGVSLGATDQTWWNMIGNKLQTSNCRIMYFVHTEKVFLIEHMKVKFKNQQKELLLSRLGIKKEADANALKSRIFVVINSDIFKDKEREGSLEEAYQEAFGKV